MSIASNLSLIQDTASSTYLGSATNIIIYGGSSGQVLTTNGSGGLYWSTSTGGISGSSGNTSSLATVSISDNAPSNPFSGQLWWDSSVGNLAIYYSDQDSSQWVDAIGSLLFPTTVSSLNVSGTFTIASTTTAFIGGAAIITTATIGNYAAASGGSTGTTTTFIISNLTPSTGTNTGALVVSGGVGIGGGLYVNGSIYSAGNLLGSTIISDSPPSAPFAGMLWWDSSIGNLAIYYNDGDSSQWVDAVNTIISGSGTSSSSSSTAIVTVSDTAPSSPSTGTLWWDSSVGNLAIYYNDGDSSQWVDAVNSISAPSSFNSINVSGTATITSGNLFVGTTTPPAGTQIPKITVESSNTNGIYVKQGSLGYYCYSADALSNGGVYYYFRLLANGSQTGLISSNDGTTTSYGTSSDYRLKENVISMTGALDKVAQLKPVTYKWKSNGSNGQGFIAHELAEVIPDCVHGEKDALDENGNIQPQSVDTSFLVATLTKAIQEQQALIESLTARLTALESK